MGREKEHVDAHGASGGDRRHDSGAGKVAAADWRGRPGIVSSQLFELFVTAGLVPVLFCSLIPPNTIFGGHHKGTHEGCPYGRGGTRRSPLQLIFLIRSKSSVIDSRVHHRSVRKEEEPQDEHDPFFNPSDS